MAGGKGTRMKLPVEKPLIDVCGKPSIRLRACGSQRGKED